MLHILSILFFLGRCSNPLPGFRLIDFGPKFDPKWMSTQEVELLMSKPKHNFMDITDFQNLSASNLKVEITRAFPEQPTHKVYVNELISSLSIQNMRNQNDKLTSYFNRYYRSETGFEAANYIFSELAKLSANNPSTSVAHFRHANFPQPSIVARIEGSGPNTDEIVILGCHEDSTAGGALRKAPGSDDDGSGAMTLLEIFRIAMEKKLES